MDLGLLVKYLFGALMVGVLVYEVFQIVIGRASEKWKRHPAKVIDVTIDTRVDEGAQESRPTIKYQYRYRGERYKGSKVKYGDLWSANYGEASEMVSGVVKGSKITVFVNPRRPNQSVLHRGYKGNPVWLLVFFSVFLYVAFKS